jgi:hypothetical protein
MDLVLPPRWRVNSGCDFADHDDNNSFAAAGGFVAGRLEMRSYRPTIDVLEDRIVPATVRRFPVPAPPPVASQLRVVAPLNVETGRSFEVTVSALDKTNKVVPGFRGTVQFSLTNVDPNAALPTNYKFTAKDAGKHTFQFTLSAVGGQTIQTTAGAISGKTNVTVDARATHFGITTYGEVKADVPTIFNVVALDANNRPVRGYTGTVHFNSTDGFADLPANYRFTTADAGSKLFQATFSSTGTFTLVVADVADGSVTGGASVKVRSPWRTNQSVAPMYNPLYNAMYNPLWFANYPLYYGYGAGWVSPWF